MEPLISVIVPVYNVEKYLVRCMESLIVQSYKNYEIILVDDGSTDSSGQICDSYVKKYDFVSVIHQKNAGLSAARNRGVQDAGGEYISFVDSDDFVSADMLEKLMGAMMRYHADISVILAKGVNEKSNIPIHYTDSHVEIFLLDTEEALEDMCYGIHFGIAAWAKLYKKELVLRYPYPVGELHEDLATTYKMIGDAKNVAVVDSVGYFWVAHKGSIMRGRWQEKYLFGITAAEEQLEYMKKNYPSLVDAGRYRYARKLLEYMNLLRGFSKEDKERFQTFRKALIPYADMLKNPRVPWIFKFRLYMVRMGYLPMCAAWKLIDIVRGR